MTVDHDTDRVERVARVIRNLRYTDALPADLARAAIAAADQWEPIETAPKDGTEVCLWGPKFRRPKVGSFRVDEGFSGNTKPLWLDDSYDDFSTGYAANPLQPTHWRPVPAPSQEKADD
ncbi:MAG: hypothetical protein RJB26_1320 [Pseudomonadota bacterium]